MDKYCLENFIEQTKQREDKNSIFETENPYMLELNIKENEVMVKAGSMVAYTGDIHFQREGILSQGVKNLIKKAISGEGAKMMTVKGTGRVYIADEGKKVQIIKLEGEEINVNGADVLAYEKTIQSDIKLMKSVAGVVGGGLFQVRLKGVGHIAVTSYGTPITLRVSPSQPVYTDPNATVAWSGGLSPKIKTDISFKTLIGRGSGESFQLAFEGSGWVIVQPYEEVEYQRNRE